MYLVFNTEAEALALTDQEGEHRNYPYWTDAYGDTRTYNSPELTKNNKWAVDVTEYGSLTDEQSAATVSTITLPTGSTGV